LTPRKNCSFVVAYGLSGSLDWAARAAPGDGIVEVDGEAVHASVDRAAITMAATIRPHPTSNCARVFIVDRLNDAVSRSSNQGV
jgi:hypothetical protein